MDRYYKHFHYFVQIQKVKYFNTHQVSCWDSKKAFSSTNILKNIYNLLCIMSLLCSFQDKIKMKVKHYIKYLQEKIFTRNIQWLLINDCMGKRITGFWFEQNVWQELDFNWCRYHFVKNLNTEGRKTEKKLVAFSISLLMKICSEDLTKKFEVY